MTVKKVYKLQNLYREGNGIKTKQTWNIKIQTGKKNNLQKKKSKWKTQNVSGLTVYAEIARTDFLKLLTRCACKTWKQIRCN